MSPAGPIQFKFILSLTRHRASNSAVIPCKYDSVEPYAYRIGFSIERMVVKTSLKATGTLSCTPIQKKRDCVLAVLRC